MSSLRRVRPGGREHGIGIGRVERGAVGLRIGRIALEHRRDHRLLGRRRLAREPVGVGRQSDRAGVDRRVHRRVDVGAVGERLAPEAHRAIGIEPLRLAERGDRRGMVEAVGEAQSLVEIALGERVRRGDREMDLAEPVVERRRRRQTRRPGPRPRRSSAWPASPCRSCRRTGPSSARSDRAAPAFRANIAVPAPGSRS